MRYMVGFVIFATTFGLAQAPPSRDGSPWMFVWVGDDDRQHDDFLAVFDVRPKAPRYGQLVTTMPLGERGLMPHHTEYQFPIGHPLFANGWAAGRTFLLDLANPRKPRIVSRFAERGGWTYPHSFARLPNGHVLATFQSRGESYGPPGGLVELAANGSFLRGTSAAARGVDDMLLWPYGVLALPDIDRVVTTSTPMGMPKWSTTHQHGDGATRTRHVQIWRLSDLQLLSTIALPAEGVDHQELPSEPRRLADGSVYVITFSCGLYRLTGLETNAPRADFVHAFPGHFREPGQDCGVPVVAGRYWLQTAASLPGVIVLDTTNPTRPTEVSRLVFDRRYFYPHWIALDPIGNRVVITGSEQKWLLLASLDPVTGRLTLDDRFREENAKEPGFNFDRQQWPHGATGAARPHGAVFGQ
jgi:hypothetical protein